MTQSASNEFCNLIFYSNALEASASSPRATLDAAALHARTERHDANRIDGALRRRQECASKSAFAKLDDL
jgi:hypothetical protein